MFKILEPPINKRQLSDFYNIPKEYPNLAYILINMQEPQEINGVTYPPTGDLYAVSDREGLQELYKSWYNLKDNKSTLNNMPLENEIGVYE